MSTFIPKSYTRSEEALTLLTANVGNVTNIVSAALANLDRAEADLIKMATGAPTGWSDLVGYVNAQAAANPGDPQWAALKGRMNKIVDDFVAYRKYVTRLRAAIEAVEA